MPGREPVAHKTIDLIARVDDKEYALAQAVVPVYATFGTKADDPTGDDLRSSATFTVGDPIIEGFTGHGQKAQQARAILEQWKRKAEKELNAPPEAAAETAPAVAETTP